MCPAGAGQVPEFAKVKRIIGVSLPHRKQLDELPWGVDRSTEFRLWAVCGIELLWILLDQAACLSCYLVGLCLCVATYFPCLSDQDADMTSTDKLFDKVERAEIHEYGRTPWA
jgi:hypothetical protein